MTRVPNPCHGCGKRTAECHARCPEYAAYQASCEAEREARRLAMLHEMVVEVMGDGFSLDDADTRKRCDKDIHKA